MGQVRVSVPAEEAEIRAVVVRCGCGLPGQHEGQPCPRPRATENLGRISYWHRNPLRRLWWELWH